MKTLSSFIPAIAIVLSSVTCGSAQNKQAPANDQLIDKIVAVVGNKMILQSDVTERLQEYATEKMADSNNNCKVLEDLMYEKLLLIEGEKDTTIVVTDDQVNQEFDKRMNYYLAQFPSKDAFESYYHETVDQFKQTLKPDIKELLIAQQQRSKIIDNLTVSPEEVKDYYASLPADSIPQINMQVEIAQITKMPQITEEEKTIARQKCEEIRQEVISKTLDMSTAAILYSEDPGSAKDGGLYKNVRRGEFVPEFEKVAFDLKDSEISQVFETQYGFHFIQLVHRHGELVDLRHVLISPVVSDEDMDHCMVVLDSIYNPVTKDSLKFSDAAAQFSDDKNTKYNGGLIVNPQTGLPKWDMNMLGQLDMTEVMNMNPGDISHPEIFTNQEGKRGYRIVKLLSITKPHRANLQQDYQLIQNAALQHKQQRIISEWIARKIRDGLFVHLDKDYASCKFQNNWSGNP